MTDKPYTDADVELVAEAAYESDNYDTHGGWYVPWAHVHKRVRQDYERAARKALDALAAAGRLASSRPRPHLDAVKAELDRARQDLAAMTQAALDHRATAGKALSELARVRAERDAACTLVVELLRSEQTADAPLGSPAGRAQDARMTGAQLGEMSIRANVEQVEAIRHHARGYADAIAALRDDDRYMAWWSSTGVKPAGTVRHVLAAYLETVGPDGPDVTKPMPEREG